MVAVRAQDALTARAPLTGSAAGTPVSPATSAVTLAAAQRAQELGFPSVAAGIYRQLLELPGADRPALNLALATVLLDDGQPAEAEKVLSAGEGLRGAAWHLRAGLAAMQLRKMDVARAELAAHFIQDLQTSVHAHPALGAARRAVGLVKRAFVNQRNAQTLANDLELAGHVQRHLQALDRAGTRDQKERLVQPDLEAAEFHATTLSCLRSTW